MAFTLFPAESEGHLVEMGMEVEWREEVAGCWTPDLNAIGAAQLFNLRTNWSSFLIKGVIIECLLYGTWRCGF